MYSFLVLGIIPGTTIQITFQMWLKAAAALLGLVALIMLWLSLRSLSTASTEPAVAQRRMVLHATQLHLRAL